MLISIQLIVAYDTFLGASPSSTNLFEVMIWLGVFGDISPLSANGYPFTPVATVTIGSTTFDLAYGLNGSVKVYSFVARGGAATDFSADLVSCVHANPELVYGLLYLRLTIGARIRFISTW
jgi:xyloglucan-specific endo-beta-1,4-glucanase